MTKKTQELSEKELRDFVELIGKPTFNFMLKRIQTYILKDKKIRICPLIPSYQF